MVSNEGTVLPRKKAKFSEFLETTRTSQMGANQKPHHKGNKVHKNMLIPNAKIQTVSK